MYDVNFKRFKVDPCLYFQCYKYGLVIWISWLYDCLNAGYKSKFLLENKDKMNRFYCD